MERGRPPLGPGLVETLQGPDEAKRRLRVILETVAGTRTIAAACAELGICEAAFHELRKQALAAAVEGLSPRPVGRPRKDADPEQRRIQELEAQVVLLKKDLHAAHIKGELAISMPHLFERRQARQAARSAKKKKTAPPTG
jgi:hypothetical protein